MISFPEAKQALFCAYRANISLPWDREFCLLGFLQNVSTCNCSKLGEVALFYALPSTEMNISISTSDISITTYLVENSGYVDPPAIVNRSGSTVILAYGKRISLS